MTQPTLYLDIEADAFGITRRHEYVFQISDYKFTYESRLDLTILDLEQLLERLQKAAPQHRMVICLGHKTNFRYAIFPLYKSNRRGIRKAACFNALRQYLSRNYETVVLPGTEADDALGIMYRPDDGDLLYSPDKDLRTIAGVHMASNGELEEVDQLEANRAFYKQALTGDSTDGYGGCPGIGANAKCFQTDEWLSCRTEEEFWIFVQKRYAMAHKTLKEKYDVTDPLKFSLTMARCARILRPGEYDFTKEQPILWKGPATKELSTVS